MSNVILRMIEVENLGQFYDPVALYFDDRMTAVVLDHAKGKSTFVSALELLSDAVISGNIKYDTLNYCRTYVNKPKGFVRIEILLDIRDASHNGVYRYGIKVSGFGILSEYLLKEDTERRIFYRYKNDFEVFGVDDETFTYVKESLTASVPVLHLLSASSRGIQSYFVRFFQRLWIVRAGGLSHRISASHLFKPSFFGKRSNVEKCCNFLRLFDNKIVNLMRVAGTSKVMVVRRNPDGYEYPVALSNESDTFIKYLLLFRAIDALCAYGGTIVLDVGDIYVTEKLAKYLNDFDVELINIIFMSENETYLKLYDISVAKKIGF